MSDNRLFYTSRQAYNVACYCFWKSASGVAILLAGVSIWLDFTFRVCAWPFAFYLFHRAGGAARHWADWTSIDGSYSSLLDLWSVCCRELDLKSSKFKKNYCFRRKNWELHLEKRLLLNTKWEFSLSRASPMSPSSSDFLTKLPPELRRMIYEYVLAPVNDGSLIYLRVAKRKSAVPPEIKRQPLRICGISHRNREKWGLATIGVSSRQLALAMVCRQIYIESIDLIYSKFSLDISLYV